MFCPTSMIGLGAERSTRATLPVGGFVVPPSPPPPHEAATTRPTMSERGLAIRALRLERAIQVPQGERTTGAGVTRKLREESAEMGVLNVSRAGSRFVTTYLSPERLEFGVRHQTPHGICWVHCHLEFGV